ncbi:MAG: hypothetical protein HC915_15085 [Anaerolineae bacterium]|nr:hypothetical protein [Anaerolineae bacterium]
MRRTLILGLALLVAGCNVFGSGPDETYRQGALLLEEPFDDLSSWERFTAQEQNIALGVEGGQYRASAGGSGFIWGLNETTHSDVILEVTAQQQSSAPENAYGVMCRADPSNNGDGYYFVVGGNGLAAIGRGEGDTVEFLAEGESDHVNTGRSENTLLAVCVGDYLALYVNGEFVMETRDERYGSGYAGLAIGSFDAGEPIEVLFDNLRIWDGSLE